ncbi:MazG-like family protein [Pseudooceanicola sp. 200-1SW]|uniref:MazG-like family protein n=1 Tax=Pseudooceanicola sp. 200-1SW TaxID=3425949 RepID=UPI003D7F7309
MNLSLHQAARILQAHWFPSGTVHPDLLDHLKDADFHSHPADIGVALALEALIEATQPQPHLNDTEGNQQMALSFQQLREANDQRQQEWPGNEKADVAFRAIEVAGECGEVAEAVKKHLRAMRGIEGSTGLIDDVAVEIADAVISLDLLAAELAIDLSEAVTRKFNLTSDKYGMTTRLPEARNATGGSA